MVTRTGLESPQVPVSTDGFRVEDEAARGGTEPADASGSVASETFLAGCARLAGEAAARGDFARARELVDRAERIAAVRAATPGDRSALAALLRAALEANAADEAGQVEELLLEALGALEDGQAAGERGGR